jgi:hypothetical protein
MDSLRPELRTFVVSVAGLSLGAWRIAFNLGAYHTVFYSQLFSAWVIITVILLMSLFLSAAETRIGWPGRLMLVAPTLVLLLNTLDQHQVLGVPDGLSVLLNALVLLIALPYALLVAIQLFNPEFFQLTETRLRAAFVITILAVLALGFYAGANNDLLVTCGDFRIAGDDTPANCRPGPPSTF